jgi:hypothetical protein
VRRLLVTASVVPTSPILVTLMKGALSSSETSVLTRATRCNIPEDTILHSHRRENLKSNAVFLVLDYRTMGKVQKPNIYFSFFLLSFSFFLLFFPSFLLSFFLSSFLSFFLSFLVSFVLSFS